MRRSTTSLATLVAPLIALVAYTTSARAQNDMCVPTIGGLTGPPTLDGVVLGDAGWGTATQFNLNAGTGVTRTAEFRMGRSGTDVFFGIIVDDPPPDNANVSVMLAFQTDGTPANDWRFIIQPFDVSLVDGPNQTPRDVKYWRNSNTWNTTPGIAPAATDWQLQNVRFSKQGSRWQLEMQIPRSSSPTDASSNTVVYWPSSGTFRFYLNIVSTSVLLTYSDAAWPQSTPLLSGALDIIQSTPGTTLWGTASLNSRPACSGVSIAWNDIGTLNTPASEILLSAGPFGANCSLEDNTTLASPVNSFFARPHNGMGDGTLLNLNASWKLADWGMPGPTEWNLIGPPSGLTGGTTNPSSSAPVADGSDGNFSLQWQLTAQQSCNYNQHRHQCMLVELDSPDAVARFINRGTKRNMNFDSASTFTQDARISAVGYGAPPNGRQVHDFVITVDTSIEQPRVVRGDSAGRHALTWIARGYQKTGTTLIINGIEYERTTLVGAFGYDVVHLGDFNDWETSFTGGGLTEVPDADGLYTLSVPPGEAVMVTTMIVADEGGGGGGGLPWWVWLLLLLILIVAVIVIRRLMAPQSP